VFFGQKEEKRGQKEGEERRRTKEERALKQRTLKTQLGVGGKVTCVLEGPHETIESGRKKWR